MAYKTMREFKVQVGKQCPEFTLMSKKKTIHEDEAAKHEGSKREKGEQTTDEKEGMMKEKEAPVASEKMGEEAQQMPATSTSQEKETVHTSPSATSKPSDSHVEKLFDLNEVFQGKTKQDFVFMFFFRENADFEDREEMWSIRDLWDELQKVGNGVTVYGFSTGSKMDKIQLMRRKLKLPFEIFPDNNYDALRQFMPVGGTVKLFGALAPGLVAKINCGFLMLGDKTIARIYSDHWSASQLLNDMKDMNQRVMDGRPLVDEPPAKEESHPGSMDKEAHAHNNNNNTNVVSTTIAEGEKPAKSEKKKKDKDKKRDKDQAHVSEGSQGEEKSTTGDEETTKEAGTKKKERTKTMWNFSTLRKKMSPRSDSTPAPISDENPTPATTNAPSTGTVGTMVTDSNTNTTNATTTTGEVGTGITPTDNGATMTVSASSTTTMPQMTATDNGSNDNTSQ